MAEIFDTIMIICFGISWPISVYKSIKSRSTQGKSVVFILAIIVGYIAGITSRVIDYFNGKPFGLSFYFCIINIVVVSIDLVLFFVNRKYEKKVAAEKAEKEKEIAAENEAK